MRIWDDIIRKAIVRTVRVDSAGDAVGDFDVQFWDNVFYSRLIDENETDR